MVEAKKVSQEVAGVKARIPDDPLVQLILSMNRQMRPEWEPKVLRWMHKNGIKLERLT